MGTFAFQLDVNHDELEAKLIIDHPVPGSIANDEALEEMLRENNVFKGVDKEAIATAFQKLAIAEEPGETFIIAQGKPAKNGKNGYIDFKVDVTGRPTYTSSESTDDEGNVDFREAMKIVSVKPGDVLAERVPPTEGVSGFNLAGKELKAKNGKPAILRAGEGVEADADERMFKAVQEGRPVFYAGTLQVSPVYQIGEDVDFNTGNIKFNGHVIVKGNVQDDFAIEANSVEIDGVVGASRIRCAGPLTIRGGINGRERADVEAGGDASIKYVNQAKVTVLGNLTVNREIVNATVWCRGGVKADKIIGGNCIALGGVEASIFGSELGVNTVVEPGINFEVRKIDNAMGELGDKIESLLRPVQGFLGDKARYRGLPEEKQQEIAANHSIFLKLKEAYLKLLAERQRILASDEYQPVKQVIVRKIIYPDVFVRTDLCMKQFKKQLTGPVALIEDIDSSTMRAANYVPGKGVIEDEDEES